MTAHQVLPWGDPLLEPPPLDFTLCRCACHTDCSLAGRADGAGWPEGCSCNETLEMRNRAKRQPSGTDTSAAFKQGMDQARRKRSARREAARRAKGLSTEQTEAIIDEEWSRNGLDPPTGMTRKSEISRITNPPNPIQQAVITATFFKDLIGAPFRFRDKVRNILSDTTEHDEEQQTYEIATSDDRIELPIDERFRPKLGGVVDEGFLVRSLGKLFSVEVRGGQHGTIELWYRPSSDSPPEPLASLLPPEADLYRQPLAAATRVGQKCTTKAFCIRDQDGDWNLGISLPLRSDEAEVAGDQ